MPFDPADIIPVGEVARLPELPEAPTPTVAEIGAAAFRQENSIGSWWSHKLGVSSEYDPDFDPFAMIENTRYVDYPEAFIDANTTEDVSKIKTRIDQEMKDRETLSHGGVTSFIATMAAGLLDPILLVPVGGSSIVGGSVLRAAARTGLAGFVGMSASEAALHTSQFTRTYGESANNIASATLLSAVLGGAVSRIASKDRARIQKTIENDMDIKAMANASKTDPDKVLVTVEELFGKDAAERADLADIKAMASASPPTQASGASASTAPTVAPTAAYEKVAKAFGVEKLSAMLHFSPMMWVMVKSKSPLARLVALTLADLPVELEKNAAGIATKASVESRVLAYEALKGQITRETYRLYRNYRRRLAGKAPIASDAIQDYRHRLSIVGSTVRDALPGAGPRMSFVEFRRKAGLSATQGDVRFVGPAAPEITELAKFVRNHVDTIKDEAITVGLFDQKVHANTAISYFMRVYKAEKLRQDPGDAFRRLAADWYMTVNPKATQKEAEYAAGEIRQHILGAPGNRIAYEAIEHTKAAPLKGRVFTVADSELHAIDMLETDILNVTTSYINTMAPDIEIMRAFGTLNWDDSNKIFKAIVDDYEAKIANVRGAERSALAKERDHVLSTIGSMWDIIRHKPVAGSHMPPDAMSKRIGRGVRQLTTLGMAGRFAISSASDFGRIILHQGLMRTLKTPLQMFQTGLKNIKLTARELEQAGAGFETLLNTRAMSMSDIADDFRPHTSLERGLSAATSNYFLINGLSPLTTIQKQFGGLMLHQRILEYAERSAAGKAKKNDIIELASLGIGEAEAKRIAKMGSHWDRTSSLFTSHTDLWTDPIAVDAFRTALRRGVDKMVTTPGVGDRPIGLVSTEMGKLIGQFRSFNFAVVNTAVIPMMQKARRADASALSGLVSQVALGMGVYWTISQLADKETSDDLNVWVAEGIDRGGAIGFYADINNMAEVLTHGRIGINAMLGGPVLSRYAGRNYVGALLGPQASRMEDIARVTAAATTGDVVQSDVRSLRRMIPYQNLFYVDKLFDIVEESANESLGIPEKARH